MHLISMAGERLTTAPKVLRCTTGPHDDLTLVQRTRCTRYRVQWESPHNDHALMKRTQWCAVPCAMGDMYDAFDWYGWGTADDSTQGVALHDWPA
jgi:hypothetical protein